MHKIPSARFNLSFRLLQSIRSKTDFVLKFIQQVQTVIDKKLSGVNLSKVWIPDYHRGRAVAENCSIVSLSSNHNLYLVLSEGPILCNVMHDSHSAVACKTKTITLTFLRSSLPGSLVLA